MARSNETPERTDDQGGEGASQPNGVASRASTDAAPQRGRAAKSNDRKRVNKEDEQSDPERSRARRRKTPVNSIRPTRAPPARDVPDQAALELYVAPSVAEGSPASARSDERAAAPARAGSAKVSPETDSWAVPQSVRDRFVQVGRRYYFLDGADAFKDSGKRLTTQSENTEVVHSLIEIAQARGWNELTVSGTERFRQEAWRQASLAGLSVRGYRPSAVEQAQLVRALARGLEGSDVGNRHESGPEAAAGEAIRSVTSAGAPAVQEPAGPSRVSPREAQRERIAGKLLDHGRDTYRHDPHEEVSYFVRIQTKEGKREIWGRDIERAMTKSLTQPQIGEEVTLERTGREPVTVKRQQRDAEGRVVKEKDFSTYLNRWVIERSDFFEARAAAASVLRDASIEPKRAVRQHPELAGTYLNLKAAEIAARTFRDPEDRQRFVSLVRGALADQVERGEPLQPVRLREGPERTPGRSAREPDRAMVRN